MPTFSAVAPDQTDDPHLREDLLATWVEASRAGGSVGFVPPVDPAAVADALDALLAGVRDGRDALGVLRTDTGGRSAAVGMGLLVANHSPLTRHWRTVARVMVHPRLQRSGAGTRLMTGLHEVARDLGLEHLLLAVRGGEGLEGFYRPLGYEVVGRHPGALRLRPGDDRDEVLLARRL